MSERGREREGIKVVILILMLVICLKTNTHCLAWPWDFPCLQKECVCVGVILCICVYMCTHLCLGEQCNVFHPGLIMSVCAHVSFMTLFVFHPEDLLHTCVCVCVRACVCALLLSFPLSLSLFCFLLFPNGGAINQRKKDGEGERGEERQEDVGFSPGKRCWLSARRKRERVKKRESALDRANTMRERERE